MVSHTRIVVALVLMLLHSLAWAVNLDVTLDSSEIATGDTVNLTITVDEQAFGKSPDLTPLKKDFEIVSNRQSSQYSMINGKITSSTSWIVTLLPKTEGYLAIPGLQYGKQTSKPLKLHVTRRAQDTTPAAINGVVYLDAQIDKKEVYVQEQLIYTVRLFHRIDLHDSTYTPPKVNDAVMEPLGNKREYLTTVNGASYKVAEQRYVLFPQQSGTLTIPPAEITGTIFLASNNSFLLDPFNGKQIRRKSPELTVTIKTQPASYPVDQPWLPARSLNLRENWKPANPIFKVGEPVTRSITIEAEGLAPSTLPPIKPPLFDNLKTYPEQAETNSNIGPRGLISTRVENLAMIATQGGDITLPAVAVTWWDVDEEKVKVATLPERAVHIEGTAAHLQTDAPLQAPTVSPDADEAPQSLSESGTHTWQWIALVALLLWLVTLGVAGWLWRKRQAPAAQPDQATAGEPAFNRAAEKAARQQFESACADNNPRAARNALIEWYRQQFHNPHIHNLDEVEQQTPDARLKPVLQKLDAALYRTERNSGNWNGAELQQAVVNALSQPKANAPVSHLEPLYPA